MNDMPAGQKEDRLFRLTRTTAIVVVAVALFLSFVVFKPAAPKSIVLLTGPEGSGYHSQSVRLAEFLNDRGLRTEVKVTLGGFENIELLLAGADDTVAYAPSNIEHLFDDEDAKADLVTLGSIAFEPLWLFYRADLEIRRIPDLAGLRVATGPDGTVVNYVARRLLELNGIADEAVVQPSTGQNPEANAEALISGNVDAIFAMGEPKSPIIASLLEADAFDFLSFERAAAYQALEPGIAKISVPEGVFDFARNSPPEDLDLLATTTNLVTLDSLYPGVPPLLLKAAAAMSEQQTFVSNRASFPNPDHVSLPLHRGAERYYSQGEKGLSRFLPYGVTRWLNHLGFVVLPLLTLAFILIKIVPVVLKTAGNIQLIGLFKKLEAVEKGHASGKDQKELLADLDLIDKKSANLFIPRSIVQDYIDFRQFLHDMRERVEGS
jgi:TRAP-type uncharacterized transport system substrate-binding protein